MLLSVWYLCVNDCYTIMSSLSDTTIVTGFCITFQEALKTFLKIIFLNLCHNFGTKKCRKIWRVWISQHYSCLLRYLKNITEIMSCDSCILSRTALRPTCRARTTMANWDTIVVSWRSALPRACNRSIQTWHVALQYLYPDGYQRHSCLFNVQVT